LENQNKALAKSNSDLVTTTWHVVALKQSLRKLKQSFSGSRWHVDTIKIVLCRYNTKICFAKTLFGLAKIRLYKMTARCGEINCL
jgi:hypothetical protein